MSYRRYSLSGGASDPYGVGAGRYGTSYGSASKYGSTSPVTTSVPGSRPRWGGGPGLGGGTCYTSLPSTKTYSSRENVGSGYSPCVSRLLWRSKYLEARPTSHIYRPLANYKPFMGGTRIMLRPQVPTSAKRSYKTAATIAKACKLLLSVTVTGRFRGESFWS